MSPPRLPCLEEAQEAMTEAWWPTVPEEHTHLDFLFPTKALDTVAQNHIISAVPHRLNLRLTALDT